MCSLELTNTVSWKQKTKTETDVPNVTNKKKTCTGKQIDCMNCREAALCNFLGFWCPNQSKHTRSELNHKTRLFGSSCSCSQNILKWAQHPKYRNNDTKRDTVLCHGEEASSSEVTDMNKTTGSLSWQTRRALQRIRRGSLCLLQITYEKLEVEVCSADAAVAAWSSLGSRWNPTAPRSQRLRRNRDLIPFELCHELYLTSLMLKKTWN